MSIKNCSDDSSLLVRKLWH